MFFAHYQKKHPLVGLILNQNWKVLLAYHSSLYAYGLPTCHCHMFFVYLYHIYMVCHSEKAVYGGEVVYLSYILYPPL